MIPERWLFYAVIGLAVFLAFWVILGDRLNRPRARKLLKWARDAVLSRAQKARVRWFGGNVFRLEEIEDLPNRYREVRVLGRLEPRQTLLLWAITWAMGRRDTLHLEISLRRHPRGEVELRRRGPLPREEGWQEGRPLPDGGRWVWRGGWSDAMTAALEAFDQALGRRIQRLSLRRRAPQVELELTEPWKGCEGAAFFDALEALLEVVEQA